MKEQPFNWEIYSQNPDEFKVYTRSGRLAINLRNSEGDYGSYALTFDVVTTDKETCTIDGHYDKLKLQHPRDLVKMVSEEPKPKTVEHWDPSFQHYYMAVWLAEENGEKSIRYSTSSISEAQQVLSFGKDVEKQKPEYKFLGVINLADHPQIKAMLEAEGVVKLIPVKP